MSETLTGRTKVVLAVLAASLLPFMVRGAEYAVIGSYAPLACIAVSLGLLALGRLAGGSSFRLCVRLWSLVLILYGVARLGLGVHFAVSPLRHGAHVMGQFTLPYYVFSAAYLLAGFYLLRNAKALLVCGEHS